ncbi:helix-turn-helix domain-containing protein [Roseateles sp.]|jgi:PAS domain S-box-containing protein|uniref:AraC family transcriptional regulator n=1 Tax=Roseateles sp. TaxID=1971397 RepID=UPI0037C60F3B
MKQIAGWAQKPGSAARPDALANAAALPLPEWREPSAKAGGDAALIEDAPLWAAASPQLFGAAGLQLLEALFEPLTDVAFFVKDQDGRYLCVNRSLWQRCGLHSSADMIGRRSSELFPSGMGNAYLVQDHAVMRSGRPMLRRLERHLYPDLSSGWCLSHKLPMRDNRGQIVGLVGMSRDLGLPDCKHPEYAAIAELAQRIGEDYAQPLALADLAYQQGLSLDRMERMFHRVFHLTPREMLVQARIDAACQRLALDGPLSIAEIALDCGYSDQSAFTRQFKATVGMTPSQYRQLQTRG